MTPDISPPIKPGPDVTQIKSIFVIGIFAFSSESLTDTSRFSACALAATSGTTPPYFSWRLFCESISEDRIFPDKILFLLYHFLIPKVLWMLLYHRNYSLFQEWSLLFAYFADIISGIY